jgi:hypothetical protein
VLVPVVALVVVHGTAMPLMVAVVAGLDYTAWAPVALVAVRWHWGIWAAMAAVVVVMHKVSCWELDATTADVLVVVLAAAKLAPTVVAVVVVVALATSTTGPWCRATATP